MRCAGQPVAATSLLDPDVTSGFTIRPKSNDGFRQPDLWDGSICRPGRCHTPCAPPLRPTWPVAAEALKGGLSHLRRARPRNAGRDCRPEIHRSTAEGDCGDPTSIDGA